MIFRKIIYVTSDDFEEAALFS